MVFSDFELPPTPNWPLRIFVCTLLLGFFAWLANAVGVFNEVNDMGSFTALTSIAPPSDASYQQSCVSFGAVCFAGPYLPQPMSSAGVQRFVESFGVNAAHARCAGGAMTLVCSGSGRIGGVVVAFHVTAGGYMITGSGAQAGIARGTRLRFTVSDALPAP